MCQHEHHGGHGDCCCGDGHRHECCGEQHGGHDCGCGDRRGHGGCCEKEHRQGQCCCEGEQNRHFRRRFHTREERLTALEEYLKDLQAEVKAVEEQMVELKAAQ